MGLRGPLRDPHSRRGERERRNGTGATAAALTARMGHLDTEADRPDWLTDEGARIWGGLVPQALADGLPWTRGDVMAIAAFCAAAAHAREAERHVAEHGIMLRTPGTKRNPEGRETINPNVKIARQFTREAMAWAAVLGLTPIARARMRIERRSYDPNNPFARYANAYDDDDDPEGLLDPIERALCGDPS